LKNFSGLDPDDQSRHKARADSENPKGGERRRIGILENFSKENFVVTTIGSYGVPGMEKGGGSPRSPFAVCKGKEKGFLSARFRGGETQESLRDRDGGNETLEGAATYQRLAGRVSRNSRTKKKRGPKIESWPSGGEEQRCGRQETPIRREAGLLDVKGDHRCSRKQENNPSPKK